MLGGENYSIHANWFAILVLYSDLTLPIWPKIVQDPLLSHLG